MASMRDLDPARPEIPGLLPAASQNLPAIIAIFPAGDQEYFIMVGQVSTPDARPAP
jgi:hypothetical protein